MLRKFVLAICMLSVLVGITAAQDDGESDASVGVRAVWNSDILVLINVGDENADLSAVTLENEVGSISAEDWVIFVDEETTLPYSLTDATPGDCLQVYLSGTDPAIPSTVECTRVIGEFTPTTTNDIVWEVSRGGFNAVVGTTATACDVTTSSCDFDVPSGREAETSDMIPAEVPVLIAWNLDILTIINASDYGADLSNLSLSNEEGEIVPVSWVMAVDEETTLSYSLTDVRPGSCLIAYLGGTDQPDLPENIDCTLIIGEFTPENLSDIVWEVSMGGFTASSSVEDVECDVVGTTCEIMVETAATEFGEEADVMEMADDGSNVRAIWNADIFVLINLSDTGVDLSGVSFESANGSISPDQWVLGMDDAAGVSYTLEDVRPGSCLISYLGGTDEPDLPENVSCSRIIGEFTPENINDIIWDVTHGGFTVSTGATCDIVGTTTCDITAPETE